MSERRVGDFAMVTVERYASHAVLGYRHRPASTLFGIEMENGAHEWPFQFLQHRACELLGIPTELAGSVQVIDL